VNTHRLEKGVNASLTSRISGIREIREREFNPSTCKAASSENARRKVNIASRGFVKGRCQGWMPQVTKWRIERGDSVKISWWSCVEGADIGELYPFMISSIARLRRKNWESQLTNSQVVSCDKRLWNCALVIVLWSHEKVELAPSAIFTRELSKRTNGSIELRF
jgi:hypothetical protein